MQAIYFVLAYAERSNVRLLLSTNGTSGYVVHLGWLFFVSLEYFLFAADTVARICSLVFFIIYISRVSAHYFVRFTR